MRKQIAVAVVCLLLTGSTRAEPVLTFEGLKNFEQIGSYYDGGAGSLGSGPGPDYGISFSPYALAYIRGQQSGNVNPFPGDPSPPTVLLVFNSGNPFGAGYPTSITMNVSNGFTQGLSFYDIAIGRAASVTIYSGLDGTGTILAEQTLPITLEAFSSSPTIVDFSGVANSVVFTGGNDQFALDNIALASTVPEPSGWICLTVGLAGMCLVFSRLGRKVGTRDGSFSAVA